MVGGCFESEANMSQRRVFNSRARWLRRLRHKRNSVSQPQREALVRRWMVWARRLYRNANTLGSAFDFAVACVYDLYLVSLEGVGRDRNGSPWPGNYEIPQYAVDIAESIMGPDTIV